MHLQSDCWSLVRRLEFIRVHHTPDATFPNGIPNPLLPENHPATADVVKAESADFGVAFDGDFDRCFFFDETGQFVPGEYVVGILASIFLEKGAGCQDCARSKSDLEYARHCRAKGRHRSAI
jgi:phosphomannomutase